MRQGHCTLTGKTARPSERFVTSPRMLAGAVLNGCAFTALSRVAGSANSAYRASTQGFRLGFPATRQTPIAADGRRPPPKKPVVYMQLTKTTNSWMPLLRGLGLNRHIRGWNRLLYALFPYAQQAATTLEINYRGSAYAAAPQHYVDWQVLTTGAYEIDDLRLFERLARHLPHATVLDIGANVGHHAFVFATLGWRVQAFEPNPDLWPIFEAKVKAASLQHVQLNKLGLGDVDEVLSFSVPEASNSGTGQFHAQALSAPAGAVQLPIRHADRFLAEQGVAKVDVIKIDIQGFEPQALRGLRATLQRDRPVVSVELGSENRDGVPDLAALQALLPVNYSFYRVRLDNWLLVRQASLAQLDARSFAGFDGNLFCLPQERSHWLTGEAPPAQS
jgi:FkbM family methyltransferase